MTIYWAIFDAECEIRNELDKKRFLSHLNKIFKMFGKINEKKWEKFAKKKKWIEIREIQKYTKNLEKSMKT